MTHRISICLVTVLSLLIVSCSSIKGLPEAPLETLGGGSFGLGRGSLIADYTMWGIGRAEYAKASFTGMITLTPMVRNNGGSWGVYGQTKQLSVLGEEEIDISTIPQKNGSYTGDTYVWADEGIPAPDWEAPNGNWLRGWLIQSEAGSCVTGTFTKDGDLIYEGFKKVLRDDGVLLAYDSQGNLLENQKEIRGAFLFVDVAKAECP